MTPQRPTAQRQYEASKAQVAARGKAGQHYDLILYGDSNTANMLPTRSRVWDPHFKGLVADPLGMGGSSVEELAWRIVYGGEAPRPPPRVAVILVGYNDARYHPKSHGVERLDWLLGWLQASWPRTRLAVPALLPSQYIDLRPLSAQYREVAKRRGIKYFSRCNRGLDPRNRQQYIDGTHLQPAGLRQWVTCMAAVVRPLLNATSAAG
ncbi:hypothetical protein CHLNCDRAFT_133124 [Chlorella variabilis]|uniref:SGNH hydrolase-type esterase domain-containing protein n=1 Tax=Chlorella variabilis TaxID=554065 RepID=E1Z2E7_CHLVA|nr:hypothetical protein CHLNCDRAFT_133124 [Chlorella variabilis]EFN59646.1 hypothetical protein CHLNCDRAFT_133124 [Chlorella variabilis]|eukprot:XP_005851748.1 hypothetical protein CHLNCDRAFT_133124 [Chlorella variabilis]